MPAPDEFHSPLLKILLEASTRVLLMSVSVVDLPTRVSLVVGNVSVPVLEMLEIMGVVKVLLVSVSVVLRPTRVSLVVGKVMVPVLLMLEIMGVVSVLLVSMSVVDFPTRVSVASGSVTVLLTVCNVASVVVVAVAALPLECLKILVLSVALYTVN